MDATNAKLTLDSLNRAEPATFMALIGGPLEGETWLAERVMIARPFADLDALLAAFESAVDAAGEAERVALIASHPDLAGKAAIAGEVSALSEREQAAAGLDRLTPDEYALFAARNAAYRAQFGFPFVICAREHTKTSILDAFAARLDNPREAEIATGVAEVLKILRLRLLDLFA